MALIILQKVRRWGDMSEKLSRYLVLEDIRAVFFKFCNGIKMKIRNRFHNDSWVGQSTNLALDYKPLASPHPISVPHSLEQTKQISVLLWYVCTKRGAILTFFHRPPPLLNRTLPPEGAPSSRPSLTETTKSSSLSWKCNFRWIESAFHPPLTPSDQTLSGQKVGTDCFYNIKRYVLS